MQYKNVSNNAATLYDQKMEKKLEGQLLWKNKDNVNHTDGATSWRSNKSFPYLDASPDGLLNCAYHRKDASEIKYPKKI